MDVIQAAIEQIKMMQRVPTYARTFWKLKNIIDMDIDWNGIRRDCTAVLALNGLLANPATSGLPIDNLAKKAVDAANALEKELALKPTPVEPPETGV